MKKSSPLIDIKYQYLLLLLPFSNIWVSVVAGINALYSKRMLLGYKFILMTGLPYLAVIVILDDALGIRITTFGFSNYIISTVFSLLTIKMQKQSFDHDISTIKRSQVEDAFSAINEAVALPYVFWIAGGVLGFIGIRMLELQLTVTIEFLSWCVLVLSAFFILISIRLFFIRKKYAYLPIIIFMVFVYATYAVA